MKCYHGTTIDNFLNLINKDKVKGDVGGTWTCSDSDNCFYVYSANKIKNIERLETIEEVKEKSIQYALESACVTASRFKRDNQIVIIELEVHSDYLEDDYSCPNMSDIASFVLSDDFNTSMIKKVYITDFLGMYTPLFALIGSDYFNDDCFSDVEIKLIEGVRGSCCDLFLDIQSQMQEELREFTFNQFIKEYKIDKNILKIA